MVDSERRTLFVVKWPVQGTVLFSTSEQELALSDVYWIWIYAELKRLAEALEKKPAFMERWESGFNDPSNLVETIEMGQDAVDLLARVDPKAAISFDALVPGEDSRIPTAEELLTVLGDLWEVAAREGRLTVEID
jgi:hypothetical protein